MEKGFIHQTAIVESDQIGENTNVWAYAHIMKDVQIGKNCNIGDHCFIENGVVVGNYVTIKNGNMIFEGVIIEDGAFIGPHVFFTNDLFPRSPRLPEAKSRYNDRKWLHKTIIKYGASLGAGSVIIAGNTIGKFAMVGAGAVVTKDIPDYALVIGNPARQIGWVCQCGEKLKRQEALMICQTCFKTYQNNGTDLSFLK
ncbi:MAG: N-acetyltransferase [Anaerolineaceae bacterium]|nr:N-acetyltransferase [Anaerolineaceae bacterium]